MNLAKNIYIFFFIFFIVFCLGKHSCYSRQSPNPDYNRHDGFFESKVTFDICSLKYKLLGITADHEKKLIYRKKDESVWREVPQKIQAEKINVKTVRNKLIFNFDSSLKDREFVYLLNVTPDQDIFIRGLRVAHDHEPIEKGVAINVSNPPSPYLVDRDLEMELSEFKETHRLTFDTSKLPVLFTVINPNENLGRWFQKNNVDDYKVFRNQLLETAHAISNPKGWSSRWARAYFATWYYEQMEPEMLIVQKPQDPVNPAWEDPNLLSRLKYFNAVIETERLIDYVDDLVDKSPAPEPDAGIRGVILYFLGASSMPMNEEDLIRLDQKLRSKRLKALIFPFLHFETQSNDLTRDHKRYQNLRLVELSLPTEFKNSYFSSIRQLVEKLCFELTNL